MVNRDHFRLKAGLQTIRGNRNRIAVNTWSKGKRQKTWPVGHGLNEGNCEIRQALCHLNAEPNRSKHMGDRCSLQHD